MYDISRLRFKNEKKPVKFSAGSVAGRDLIPALTLWHTQPPVRRSEPPMFFAFSSSFLSVDGETCHISF
jgi:hypothetical protein